jgi:hypothetical protein
MTYQVLEMSLSTTVQTFDETTGKSISDVLSTVIRTKVEQPTLMTTSSSALHAEFKEIVCKSFPNKKGLL